MTGRTCPQLERFLAFLTPSIRLYAESGKNRTPRFPIIRSGSSCSSSIFRLLQIVCGNTLLSTSALITAGAGHFAAMPGTFAAGSGAILHSAYLLATFCTGIADLGADPAYLVAKGGAAQHEVDRGLTDLGAVHHQAKMIGRNMLAPGLQAVSHRFMQARLITPVTCVDA